MWPQLPAAGFASMEIGLGRGWAQQGGFGVLRRVLRWVWGAQVDLGWLEGFGLGLAEEFGLSEGLLEGFLGGQKGLGQSKILQCQEVTLDNLLKLDSLLTFSYPSSTNKSV